MLRIGFFLAIVIASSIAPAAVPGLPHVVAERLESIVDLESDAFVGTYRISITSVIQKPNGKSRKESLIEAEIAHHLNQSRTRSLLKYIEDGTDVTEKKRTEFEGEDGGRPRDKQDEDDDHDLLNPFGETADRYRFGSPVVRGSFTTMTFEPVDGHETDENIARGTIAWDESSLEPKWLEMEAIHPPSPLKELRLKMEFAEIDGDLFVSRLVTDGLAKILLLKRQFHMEMRFYEIRSDTKDGG